MENQWKYYIGEGDPFGEDGPNDLFNDIYVDRLKELGIKEEDMAEVAKMFEEIYSIGFSNGKADEAFFSDPCC